MQLITTEDGSQSLLDEVTGELHHNRAGAYTEALVNYVQPSGVLNDRAGSADNELRVLDACWGTGYNTFVLLAELSRKETARYGRVEITGIEVSAPILELAPQILEFHRFQSLCNCFDVGVFRNIEDRNTERSSEPVRSETQFDLANGCTVQLSVILGDLRVEVPRLAKRDEFDLVFHDPFSPKRVPELWTVDLFRCYHKVLSARKGKVLTYSAASAVRGGLNEAGFVVRRSTALGGKSGGTVGSIAGCTLDDRFVFPLKADELAKSGGASGIPYRDETFAASRDDIQARRRVEQLEFSQRTK